jgi:hypothetical protein
MWLSDCSPEKRILAIEKEIKLFLETTDSTFRKGDLLLDYEQINSNIIGRLNSLLKNNSPSLQVLEKMKETTYKYSKDEKIPWIEKKIQKKSSTDYNLTSDVHTLYKKLLKKYEEKKS